MKKFMSLLLIFIVCLCTVQVFADDVKYAARSEYEVYIDYTPIDSYLINDLTYIEVEDLVNYGFTVEFDETAQSYNVSRIKFATPMYTREMWKKEITMKTGAEIVDSNITVYLDGELTNSCFANGKTLVQIDELQKYGEVIWNEYDALNVYIFREEMQKELDKAENVVEMDFDGGTYKGQVDENNQPHGIGCWTDDHNYEGKFKYLGYFTHSKPDGLMYKETYRTVSHTYSMRYTYFIGKVDGAREAKRVYEHIESDYPGEAGRDVLISRDANFGVSCLPVSDITDGAGYDTFYDETIYTEGCYYEYKIGKIGKGNYRIWHNGKDKQFITDLSYGVGEKTEPMHILRKTNNKAKTVTSYYEYTNSILEMYTGAVQTVSGTDNDVVLNASEDGGGIFITVLLNNEGVAFDALPVKQNDRVLVPLRAISEALGAKVTWNNDEKTAVIEKDGKNITLQIGNNVMKIDNREITLDVAPEIIDGRTLVPVRAVSEAFEAKVDWNNELQQVIVKTE